MYTVCTCKHTTLHTQTPRENLHFFLLKKKIKTEILVNILELELLCIIHFSASHWWALWLLVYDVHTLSMTMHCCVYMLEIRVFFRCCSLFHFVTLYTVHWLRSLSSAWRHTLFSGCALLAHSSPSANTQSKCTIVIIRILRSICRCSGGRNRTFPCVRAILLLTLWGIWVSVHRVRSVCESIHSLIYQPVSIGTVKCSGAFDGRLWTMTFWMEWTIVNFRG